MSKSNISYIQYIIYNNIYDYNFFYNEYNYLSGYDKKMDLLNISQEYLYVDNKIVTVTAN